MQYTMQPEELSALIVGVPFLALTAHVMLDNVIAGVAWVRSLSTEPFTKELSEFRH